MRRSGIFYGIGVGPGDPELISVKGARILSCCQHIFVPKTRMEKHSTALTIAQNYIPPHSKIYELVFPMTTETTQLSKHWDEAAEKIACVIRKGEDACFLTLGDPFLYSTYIYLLRGVRSRIPSLQVITIPGITSFSAAAALTEFSIGEGSESVSIIPTVDNLDAVREALSRRGTVILMKVGRQLPLVLDLLDQLGMLGRGVFVSRAGMEDQYTEVDLFRLKEQPPEPGYFSIMLIHAGKDGPK